MSNREINNTQGGFSLMEIMIVVAIIGIITAIVLPSYNSYIERTNRKAAIAEMLTLQQIMERSYTVNNGIYTIPNNLPKTKNYNLSVTLQNNGQSYIIMATLDKTKSRDICGNLSIDSYGVKTSSKSSGCFR